MRDGPVRGVIFDLDGTLVLSNLDFAHIRAEIGIQDATPILEYLEKRPRDEFERGMRILDEHEREAANNAVLNVGAGELLEFLRHHRARTSIVTRNSRECVDIVMKNLGFTADAIVARTDAPPKPSPEPLLLACRLMGLRPGEVIFVGDYEFDRVAGRNAQIETWIVCNKHQPTREDELPSLHEVAKLLERRVPPAIG